jgi:hypothetical protein
MTNTNCLAGIRCPGCNQESRFVIEALISVTVTDDGVEDQDGNCEWYGGSPCSCPECEFLGTITDFKIENHERTAGAA